MQESSIDRLRSALASRYALERELGAGGMATVYLARDVRHDRLVALKVLRPELSAVIGTERFLREIRVTANLQHPHVLPLYDSGSAAGLLFYVMPYVEGESLRDRLRRKGQLPVDDAVAITCAVARALDYAHRRGVVHRDIKPENILLQDGQPLVADFGVAIAIRQAGGERLTETGLAVGTPQYMSPEQATGERELDARSDIYSLGVILYEMLAGSPPHAGATAQAVIARTVTEPPPSLGAVRENVTPELEQVVRRALAKAPADRYDTAQDFVRALDTATAARDSSGTTAARVGGPGRRVALAATAVAVVLLAMAGWYVAGARPGNSAPAPIQRLAVLPLDNLIGDTMAFFVDGMHDAMIGELARLDGLDVVSRTSVRPYRDSGKSLGKIAEELGVDAIVEGSVFSDGRNVRVQAQLVRARPERHLWSESYDRRVGDVLVLHREIARAVAGAIQLTLSPRDERRLAMRGGVDPDALNDYLRGRYHFNQFGGPSQDSLAFAYFGRALHRDSSFALAYAGLADALAARGWPRLESLERARSLALRAIELDSTLAEPYSTLGGVRHWLDWDWEGSRKAFERAIALNPSYAQARQWHAELLVTLGQLDSAVAEVRRAEALDPLSPVIVWNVGRVLWFARRPREAASYFDRVLELVPGHPMGHEGLLQIHAHEGNEEEAFRHLRAMAAGSRLRDDPAQLAELDSAFARGGLRGVFELQRQHASTGDAVLYDSWLLAHLWLGRYDAALALLERGYRERSFEKGLPKVVSDPALDPLRSHARYQSLLRRMGLQDPVASGRAVTADR